jgi:hypothetical protein
LSLLNLKKTNKFSFDSFPASCSKTDNFLGDSLHRNQESNPSVTDTLRSENEWEMSFEELTWDHSDKGNAHRDADSVSGTPKYGVMSFPDFQLKDQLSKCYSYLLCQNTGAYILSGLIVMLSVIVWQLLRAIGESVAWDEIHIYFLAHQLT